MASFRPQFSRFQIQPYPTCIRSLYSFGFFWLIVVVSSFSIKMPRSVPKDHPGHHHGLGGEGRGHDPIGLEGHFGSHNVMQMTKSLIACSNNT